MLVENNDDYIRRKLIEKYNAYYRHWKDFNLLIAVFAIIGLVLAISQWESEFSERGKDGMDLPEDSFFTDLIICLVSLMGCIAVVFKWYFESVW